MSEKRPFLEHDPEIAFDFVKEQEGESLTAYKDSGGIWTIGIGHTGSEVVEGMLITERKSREYAIRDMTLTAKSLGRRIHQPVSEKQYIALLSLAFNVGVSSVSGSNLVKQLNNGNEWGAAAEFTNGWNTVKVNGVRKIVPGLTARRKRERTLFEQGIEG